MADNDYGPNSGPAIARDAAARIQEGTKNWNKTVETAQPFNAQMADTMAAKALANRVRRPSLQNFPTSDD